MIDDFSNENIPHSVNSHSRYQLSTTVSIRNRSRQFPASCIEAMASVSNREQSYRIATDQ